MIDAMKQALEALEWIVKVNAMDYEYKQKAAEPITALRQAIAEAEKPPIYVERATTDYEDGWEEGFKAGAEKEKESTPLNVDPRLLLGRNSYFTKNIENRLCDLERRMAKIETQPAKEATLQEITDIGQWDNSDMAHRSGGLSVEQEPVASIYISSSGEREFDDWNCALPIGRNELYTAPPKCEWQGLTDEIKDDADPMFYCGAKWAEAKLKEKNT
jgi:hypothetical protein